MKKAKNVFMVVVVLVLAATLFLGCGKGTKAAGGGSGGSTGSTADPGPTAPTAPITSTFTPPAPTLLSFSISSNYTVVLDFGAPVEFCHEFFPLNECIWIYEEAYYNDGILSGNLSPSNKLKNFTGSSAFVNSDGDLQIVFSPTELPGQSDTLQTYHVWRVSWNIAVNSDAFRYANGQKNAQFSTAWVTANSDHTDWTTARTVQVIPSQGWPAMYPQLTNVQAASLGTNSVRLSWDLPSNATENYGELLNYIVHLKNVRLEKVLLSQVTVQGTRASTTINNTIPFADNQLNIAPVNAATLLSYYANVNWSTTVSVHTP